ncbi:MAG: hypothetical protein JW737_05700 [Acidobacteria bacterium]|nr:hypothetical protein [Acidobacteriota bacterium]
MKKISMNKDKKELVLKLLKGSPCNIQQMQEELGLLPSNLQAVLTELLTDEKITTEAQEGVIIYKLK